MRARMFAVLAIVGMAGGGSYLQPRPDAPATAAGSTSTGAPAARGGPVQIEMRNLRLHLDDGIVADVARLRGEMRSLIAGEPPSFDNPRSYALHVRSAELWIDTASLTEALNRYAFAYPGAPLSRISVRTTKDGRLEQKALLRKGLRVPVSMTARVMTTADGKLRLHVESEKMLGLGTTKLLHLFGLKLQTLVHLDPSRGVAITADDIDIDLAKVLPPPRMVGRLTRVEIVGDRLHQVIGESESDTLAPGDTQARNYIYFSGSTLRFGKLTMTDTDLQLIDQEPSDAFDFFPAKYRAQLVAGYSKNTPDGGLRTFMPDYAKVARRRTTR